MLATRRLSGLQEIAVFPARRLTPDALLTDLHLHSDAATGRAPTAAMLAAAMTLGLRVVGFPERVRRGATWWGAFSRDARETAQEYPELRVIIGIEAQALDRDGRLDVDPGHLSASELVLATCGGYPDGRGGLCAGHALDIAEAARIEFETCMALLEHPEVDVLAQPGSLTRKRFGSFPDAYLMRLVIQAARERRAIELCGDWERDDLERMLGWCKDADAWVALGSNAHRVEEVGRIARLLEGRARVMA